MIVYSTTYTRKQWSVNNYIIIHNSFTLSLDSYNSDDEETKEVK